MDLQKLKEPFPESDIEWRASRCGVNNDKAWVMCLAYIDARAVMDRLDEVCGMDGWYDTYQWESGGVVCYLSLRTGTDGVHSWITKVDGSPETQVEAFKGGISKALVRTAAKWGVGRYLYNLTENFAPQATVEKPRDVQSWHKAFTKDKKTIYWKPPVLPEWALPKLDPGEWVIPFGNDVKGKAIKECTREQLEGLVEWLENKSKETGKPIVGAASVFIHKTEQFLGVA